MDSVTTIDYFALAPELTMVATSLVVLLVELFLSGERKRWVNPIAAIGPTNGSSLMRRIGELLLIDTPCTASAKSRCASS